MPRNTKSPRQRMLMDRNWRFALGHAADPEKDFGYGPSLGFWKAGTCGGPPAINFDDSGMEPVDLPHDWQVALPFDRRGSDANGFKAIGPNFPGNSVGWYRKTFSLSAGWDGKRIELTFDGVFRDCRVFLNGHYVGRNWGGYNGFRFEVGELVTPAANVLAVRVDASRSEGWFYEGAGIYRHVWLTKTEPLAVARHGTFVSSKVARGAAALTIRTRVENATEKAARCDVRYVVRDPEGREVASGRAAVRVPAAAGAEVESMIRVARPQLWSPETPRLYTLVTEICVGGKMTDVEETTFGIRTAKFDPDRGFLLNGKRVKLKGVCCHQDHAGVGSALPDAIQDYRIRRLKAMGCNAYRCAHNPPTPELLDACDRLGMLVMDETRPFGTSDDVLDQLAETVLRDRNHPCVVIWSLGNEEMLLQATETGARIFRAMKRLVRRLDPTRPATLAMNADWGKGVSHAVDVHGCNYIRSGNVDKLHRSFPRVPIVYSEACGALATRGQVGDDERKGYVSARDRVVYGWATSLEAMWQHVAERDFVAGTFIWTGFDYRGEPGPKRDFPCIASNFGVLDLCGFAKDRFHYLRSQWSAEPMIHILPHWNAPAKRGQSVDVWVYTNANEAELLLNGESLGRQAVPPFGHVGWSVPYEPGTLEARGFKGRRQVTECVVQTTGRPAGLVLAPDRTELAANGEDATVVNVAVVDDTGLVVPTASDLIQFCVTGPARILGVGNGDPSSVGPDKAEKRCAFRGLAQCMLQAGDTPGRIMLKAKAEGLASASADIRAGRATQRPGL